MYLNLLSYFYSLPDNMRFSNNFQIVDRVAISITFKKDLLAACPMCLSIFALPCLVSLTIAGLSSSHSVEDWCLNAMLRNRVPPLTFQVPMATEILDGLENLSSCSHTARSTLGEAVINYTMINIFNYTSLSWPITADVYLACIFTNMCFVNSILIPLNIYSVNNVG